MRLFRLHVKTNVLTSQAYGCWLYLQLGSLALFFGEKVPAGFRIEWVLDRRWLPRIRWRHDTVRAYGQKVESD